MAFTDLVKTPVYEIFGRPKKVADVGIELEVEGIGLPDSAPHWQMKPEGSLQNGAEYITKPIKIDAVKVYVDGLRQFFINCGTQVKPSYRCSTHIHMNVLPASVEDVLGILTIFTMFEPLLLTLCGPQRDGNLFCMSSYDTGDLVSSFENLCKTIDSIKTRGWAYERGKYSSLNTGRLTDLGTLEARCFPLSLDGAQVSTWAGWLLKMRDMAKAEPDKTFRDLWKRVRQNPTWYANAIFGDLIHSVPNSSSLVDMGTENAYEMTKVLKKYHSKPSKKEDDKSAKVKKTIADWDQIASEDQF